VLDRLRLRMPFTAQNWKRIVLSSLILGCKVWEDEAVWNSDFEALFPSGFGLAASTYGLPDIGFIGLVDLTAITSRLRALLPDHQQPAVASHVARSLERCGASGVVLDDQARPRRCGHLDGKRLLPLPDYAAKLEAVLQSRSSLVVVACTDASDPDGILRRVHAYVEAGCDAVLADGVRDADLIAQLSRMVSCPVFCNVIGGGKVPAGSRADLAIGGVQGLIYSTPCLFAAQDAIEQALQQLIRDDVPLADAIAAARDLADCHEVLETNLERAGAGWA
jgi:2-methylisocitrate lyase-like PEP mutase family enzyme